MSVVESVVNNYLIENPGNFDGKVSVWRNIENDVNATRELHKDENFGEHVAGK